MDQHLVPPEPSYSPCKELLLARKRIDRIVLLYHASQCTGSTDGGPCLTPQCAEMKQVLQHIGACKDPRCAYPHCLSSRYVLRHYRDCKDPSCDVCVPARAMIAST